jgi:hypothetical protein
MTQSRTHHNNQQSVGGRGSFHGSLVLQISLSVVCKRRCLTWKVQNVNETRDRTVRAAKSVTSEMLVGTWPQTEYRLDMCRAHKKLCEVQCLEMYRCIQYTLWLKINILLFYCLLRVSYPMGTRGSFPGGKATGAWSWPLTIQYRGQRMSGAIPLLPQYFFMAWCSVKEKSTGTTFTVIFCHLWPEILHFERTERFPWNLIRTSWQ